MKNFKLLALDMDGTVVRHFSGISRPVRHAIHKAMAKGVKICFATGRNYQLAHPFFYELGLVDDEHIHATNNGATIITSTGKILHETLLNMDTYQALVNRLATKQIPCAISTSRNTFFSIQNYEPIDYTHETDQDKIIIEVKDYQELLALEQVCSVGARGTATTIEQITHGMPEVACVNAIHDYYDIWSVGLDKGSAIRWIADYYNIPLSETMAIGDGDNDASMLKTVGLGCAMGQGSERAKASAKIIGPSVEDDGVAKLIERYLLNT